MKPFPVPATARVIAAVSGGVDSMVLLDLLRSTGVEIALVVHVNYHVRSDAHVHQKLVESYCHKYQLPLHVAHAPQCDTGNFENWAREFRYELFSGLRHRHRAEWICTGHHRGDHLETILMHWERGSGFQGLRGIPEQRGVIWRPLLSWTRDDISAYAEQHQVPYYEDSTNQDISYTRNKQRQQLAQWSQEDPSIQDCMLDIGRLASAYQQLLDHLLCTHPLWSSWMGSGQVEVAGFVELPLVLQWSWLRAWAMLYTGSTQDLYLSHIQEVQHWIQTGQSGTQKQLRTHLILLLEQGFLKSAGDAQTLPATSLPLGQTTSWGDYRILVTQVTKQTPITPQSVRIGVREPLQLTVRSWRSGDRFQPLGLAGSKKLSDYFIDTKVPRSKRSQVPILTHQDQIVMVSTRLDQRYRDLSLPYLYDLSVHEHSY